MVWNFKSSTWGRLNFILNSNRNSTMPRQKPWKVLAKAALFPKQFSKHYGERNKEEVFSLLAEINDNLADELIRLMDVKIMNFIIYAHSLWKHQKVWRHAHRSTRRSHQDPISTKWFLDHTEIICVNSLKGRTQMEAKIAVTPQYNELLEFSQGEGAIIILVDSNMHFGYVLDCRLQFQLNQLTPSPCPWLETGLCKQRAQSNVLCLHHQQGQRDPWLQLWLPQDRESKRHDNVPCATAHTLWILWILMCPYKPAKSVSG